MHLRAVAFSWESKTEPVLLAQTRFRAGVGKGKNKVGHKEGKMLIRTQLISEQPGNIPFYYWLRAPSWYLQSLSLDDNLSTLESEYSKNRGFRTLASLKTHRTYLLGHDFYNRSIFSNGISVFSMVFYLRIRISNGSLWNNPCDKYQWGVNSPNLEWLKHISTVKIVIAAIQLAGFCPSV